MAHYAVEAADALSAEGLEAEVLDLRTIRPARLGLGGSRLKRTGKVLIVHEDKRVRRLGAEVAAQIGEKAFECSIAPVRRLRRPGRADLSLRPIARGAGDALGRRHRWNGPGTWPSFLSFCEAGGVCTSPRTPSGRRQPSLNASGLLHRTPPPAPEPRRHLPLEGEETVSPLSSPAVGTRPAARPRPEDKGHHCVHSGHLLLGRLRWGAPRRLARRTRLDDPGGPSRGVRRSPSPERHALPHRGLVPRACGASRAPPPRPRHRPAGAPGRWAGAAGALVMRLSAETGNGRPEPLPRPRLPSIGDWPGGGTGPSSSGRPVPGATAGSEARRRNASTPAPPFEADAALLAWAVRPAGASRSRPVFTAHCVLSPANLDPGRPAGSGGRRGPWAGRRAGPSAENDQGILRVAVVGAPTPKTPGSSCAPLVVPGRRRRSERNQMPEPARWTAAARRWSRPAGSCSPYGLAGRFDRQFRPSSRARRGARRRHAVAACARDGYSVGVGVGVSDSM